MIYDQEEAFTDGSMEKYTQASFYKTNQKGMVFKLNLKKESMKANGQMAIKMVMESLHT